MGLQWAPIRNLVLSLFCYLSDCYTRQTNTTTCLFMKTWKVVVKRGLMEMRKYFFRCIWYFYFCLFKCISNRIHYLNISNKICAFFVNLLLSLFMNIHFPDPIPADLVLAAVFLDPWLGATQCARAVQHEPWVRYGYVLFRFAYFFSNFISKTYLKRIGGLNTT